MPAREGNKNAAKEKKGVQVNFYLGVDEVEHIRQELIEWGMEPTEQAIRRQARLYAMNGIQLETLGKCKIEGCWYAAEVHCTIPSGNAFCPGKFCRYHYGQIHGDPDERDEIDIVLGRPLFESQEERQRQ